MARRTTDDFMVNAAPCPAHAHSTRPGRRVRRYDDGRGAWCWYLYFRFRMRNVITDGGFDYGVTMAGFPHWRMSRGQP